MLKAKYSSSGDPSTNTPPFTEGEIMKLIHRHDNGWLEVETSSGQRGYVAPAWVDEMPQEQPAPAAAAIPPPPESPLPAPPSPQKEEATHTAQAQPPSRGSTSAPGSPKRVGSTGRTSAPGSPKTTSAPKLVFPELVQETTVDTVDDIQTPAPAPAAVQRAGSLVRQGSKGDEASAPEDDSHSPADREAADEDGAHHSHKSGSNTALADQATPSSSQSSPVLGGAKGAAGPPAPPKTAEKPKRPAPVVRARPQSFHSPATERSDKFEHARSGLSGPAPGAGAAPHMPAGGEGIGKIGAADFQAQLAARLGAPPPVVKKAPPTVPQRAEATRISDEVTASGLSMAPMPLPGLQQQLGAQLHQQLQHKEQHRDEHTDTPTHDEAQGHDAASAVASPPGGAAGAAPRKVLRRAPDPPAGVTPKGRAQAPVVRKKKPSEDGAGGDGDGEHTPQQHQVAAQPTSQPTSQPSTPKQQQQQQQQQQQDEEHSPLNTSQNDEDEGEGGLLQGGEEDEDEGRMQSPTLPHDPETGDGDEGYNPASLLLSRKISREDMEALDYRGTIERKLTMEFGKEVKKRGWQSFYVVLAGPTLYFFTSEKDQKKGKKYVWYLDMSDKFLANASSYTKRRNAVVVGNDSVRVILQTPDENELAKLVNVLSHVKGAVLEASWGSQPASYPSRRANTMPSKMPAVSSAAIVVPSIVSPLKRVPSDEDLTEERDARDKSPTPSPSKESKESKDEKYGFVRKKLNKYLRSRPKKAELMQKGILQEAVFGNSIENQVVKEVAIAIHAGVPVLISKCMAFVEKHLREPGIYRISGNSAHIQRLVAEANKDCASLSFEGLEDVHAVTGLLKLYFRESSEPVFTDALYDSFINAGKIADPEERGATLRKLVSQLPASHRSTLAVLFEHLRKVSSFGDENKMHSNNIAIVFGPTLLRSNLASMDAIIMDTPYQSSVVEECMKQPTWFS